MFWLNFIFGVNIFLESGFLNIFFEKTFEIFGFLKFPFEIFPMMIMRSISGSSSLAILTNIFENHGPDSYIGRLASVIQGSTETTFYVLSLYFSIVGIKASTIGATFLSLSSVSGLFLIEFLTFSPPEFVS